MISGDLNQLLKKIKRHRSIQPVQPSISLPPSHLSFSRAFSLVPPSLLCTIMRASHVERKRDYLRHGIENLCRASLIIGCTTTTILERLSFRRRFPFGSTSALSLLPPRPALPARHTRKGDPSSSSSETSTLEAIGGGNVSEWIGKSTTRPGSRVEELERLGMPLEWRRVSDCLRERVTGVTWMEWMFIVV